MRRSFTFTTSVSLFALWMSAWPASGQPEWRSIGFYYHRNNRVEMFYDAGSFKRINKRIKQVWIKQIESYEDDKAKQVGIEEHMESRKRLGWQLDGQDKYAYSTSLIQFDCSKRTARNFCIVDYDETGKLLGKECFDKFPFAPVRTAVTTKLLEVTCKQK